jgi:SAM-dependent methyltransferase
MQALALQGATSLTGYDLSRKRIKVARLLARTRGVDALCRFEVRDGGKPLPLDDESMDIVLSHRGALSYSDPRVVVSEVARVLRPGGLLAACVVSPLAVAGYWLKEGQEYLETVEFDDGKTLEYALPFGEWLRLLRSNDFEVEDVIELPCPRLPHPVEQVWKARKR